MRAVIIPVTEVEVGDRVCWEVKGDCWRGDVIKVNHASVVVNNVNKYTNSADQIRVAKDRCFETIRWYDETLGTWYDAKGNIHPLHFK